MSTPPLQDTPEFRLVSVDRADAPAGATGQDWYRYVIAQGENIIAGQRRGSVASVRVAAERIVAMANERRQGQKAKSPPRRAK